MQKKESVTEKKRAQVWRHRQAKHGDLSARKRPGQEDKFDEPAGLEIIYHVSMCRLPVNRVRSCDDDSSASIRSRFDREFGQSGNSARAAVTTLAGTNRTQTRSLGTHPKAKRIKTKKY